MTWNEIEWNDIKTLDNMIDNMVDNVVDNIDDLEGRLFTHPLMPNIYVIVNEINKINEITDIIFPKEISKNAFSFKSSISKMPQSVILFIMSQLNGLYIYRDTYIKIWNNYAQIVTDLNKILNIENFNKSDTITLNTDYGTICCGKHINITKKSEIMFEFNVEVRQKNCVFMELPFMLIDLDALDNENISQSELEKNVDKWFSYCIHNKICDQIDNFKDNILEYVLDSVMPDSLGPKFAAKI